MNVAAAIRALGPCDKVTIPANNGLDSQSDHNVRSRVAVSSLAPNVRVVPVEGFASSSRDVFSAWDRFRFTGGRRTSEMPVIEVSCSRKSPNGAPPKKVFIMRAYVLDHLTDAELLRTLASLVAQDRSVTAAMLAHIAEVDARKLYLPAGYASMHAYCVGRLRLSEDAASKRIHAARAARAFPVLFEALADGRLHLTGLCLLAPKLNPATVDELLAAATHRTKAEIEALLAQRYPQSECLPLVCAEPTPQHAPAHVACVAETPVTRPRHAPAHVAAPIAGERFVLQLSMSKSTHDKLRRLQELLSHTIPAGDLAEVLDYALDTAITQVEKRKCGSPNPRQARGNSGLRHIPAHVRRAVWERDGGRCTFVADDGHRCGATSHLEFDHIEPLARGGTSTVDNVRLQCRAHNQFQAERAFGAEFMRQKRDEARVSAERERTLDTISALRSLGYRMEQARHAAESSSAPDLTLEQQVRAALRILCPARGVRHEARAASSST